jgi:hypothetical protein
MYSPDLRVIVTIMCFVEIKCFILMPNQAVFLLTVIGCVIKIIFQSTPRKKGVYVKQKKQAWNNKTDIILIIGWSINMLLYV